MTVHSGVTEWPKVYAWKAYVRASEPWVRIPVPRHICTHGCSVGLKEGAVQEPDGELVDRVVLRYGRRTLYQLDRLERGPAHAVDREEHT